MGAITTLTPTQLRAEPGGYVTATITVRNSGSVVDEFTFEVLGAAAGWSTVEPAVLRLLPGAEETATLTCRPPRSSDAVAGDVPVGVKVSSKEDQDGSSVEEAVLTVAPFADVGGELLPRTSHGRRRMTHEIAIDNRGNDQVVVDVVAFDPDERLRLSVAEPGLVIGAGMAAFTKIDVKPVKRFWRGPDRTLPFFVEIVSQDGTPPVQVPGNAIQQAMLPKWFFKALLALLLLLLLLWLLWLTVLRPTIESLAGEAVEEELAEQAAAIAALEEDQAAGAAADGDQQALIDELLEKVNELLEAQGDEPIPAPPAPTPTDDRLAVSAASGGSDLDVFTVPEGTIFSLTDIVLQNPTGNRGTLTISRDDGPLLTVALENFRDLDYHFVAPAVFGEGQDVRLTISCEEESVPGEGCEAFAYIAGTSLPVPEPEETEEAEEG